MLTTYLEQALQVVPNEQLLINMVSQRVKQLNRGERPLVDTHGEGSRRLSAAAIALKEIAEGKIQVVLPGAEESEAA